MAYALTCAALNHAYRSVKKTLRRRKHVRIVASGAPIQGVESSFSGWIAMAKACMKGSVFCRRRRCYENRPCSQGSRISRRRVSTVSGGAKTCLDYAQSPIRLSLLRLLDSNFPGNSLWAWEFHPLKSRFCLSQTL